MLIRFTKKVNLSDVGKVTKRCEALNVQYKFIQELATSYLVVESAEHLKLEELYHQFRHLDFVADVSFPVDPDDPLRDLSPVKIKFGNRWIGTGSRPVIIAGSPYLESQKDAVSLASNLATIGVNIYKAGPYRPTDTLAPKALYERTGSIVDEISRKSGILSTGMVEKLGPKNALSSMSPCAYHVPGKFMVDTNLLEQLAGIGEPILLERHPGASDSIWLEAASTIIKNGNESVALIETGRLVGDSLEIDLVGLSKLIESCPLPILVYASRPAESEGQVRSIAKAALAIGAAGIIIDVHPNPLEGLLTEGFCLSLTEFENVFASLKPLIV
jgi:3-deoxy-7-phosphoheptulonate synthase